MHAAAELRAQYGGVHASPELKAALRASIAEVAHKQGLQVPVSHAPTLCHMHPCAHLLRCTAQQLALVSIVELLTQAHRQW